MRALIVCLFLLSDGLAQHATAPATRAYEKLAAEEPAAEKPTAEPVLTPDAIDAAIRRGFEFLRKTQSKDGAWGSHDPVAVQSAQLGFGMLSPGSHDGVRTACTSICAKALLQYDKRTQEDQAMLDKAIANILQHVRLAYDPGNAFNCWGYSFNLDFLTTLNAHAEGAKYREKLKAAIGETIAGLKRMQVVEGGWAYYTSVMLEGSSISFVTGSIMLGLLRARDQGFEIPPGMLEDAARILKTMRQPNNNYIYGTYLKFTATHHLEDLSAGGRTIVCGLAQHLFDGSFTRADLINRSRNYFDNIDYVETIGNKRIIPHRDAPQNISGYFFYYGAQYASEVLAYLGNDASVQDWHHVAQMIMRNQQREGSWWDTICYDYGDKWGTGFAVQCLEAYLKARGPRAGDAK